MDSLILVKISMTHSHSLKNAHWFKHKRKFTWFCFSLLSLSSTFYLYFILFILILLLVDKSLSFLCRCGIYGLLARIRLWPERASLSIRKKEKKEESLHSKWPHTDSHFRPWRRDWQKINFAPVTFHTPPNNLLYLYIQCIPLLIG